MGTPWELDGNTLGTDPKWMLLRISLASHIENLMGTHWEHYKKIFNIQTSNVFVTHVGPLFRLIFNYPLHGSGYLFLLVMLHCPLKNKPQFVWPSKYGLMSKKDHIWV